MDELTSINFAVNGTLMRGLELNRNLQAVGAMFVREARTAPTYRLWSIADRYPAMQQVKSGEAIALEIWSVPPAGLAKILLQEPPGLCIGKVMLEDGAVVLGVLGEAVCCEQGQEITQYGGWRNYVSTLAPQHPR